MAFNAIESKLAQSAFLEAVDAWKQAYLSQYCISKCSGTCCDFNRNFLILDRSELGALSGGRVCAQALQIDGQALYRYSGEVCPQYDPGNRRCKIHEHPHRPLGCKDYPLYIERLGSNGNVWVGIARYCQLNPSDEEFKVLCRIAETFGISINKL